MFNGLGIRSRGGSLQHGRLETCLYPSEVGGVVGDAVGLRRKVRPRSNDVDALWRYALRRPQELGV